MTLIDRSAVVRIHLDHLNEILTSGLPELAGAVRASLSLRFLLDQNALGQIAHKHGLQINIEAPDLSGVPFEDALFFVCGGYEIGNTRVSSTYMYREPGKLSVHRGQYENQIASSPAQHPLAKVKLGKFKDMPCIGVVGRLFKREAVVRYVANRCGGAHHHDDSQTFDAMEKLLTDFGEAADFNGLSAVFAETLGAAYFLIKSPDVEHLRSVL